MENYYNYPPAEPVQPQNTKKPSPFADSPYQSPFQTSAPVSVEPPVYVPPVKKKKKRSLIWLWVLLTVVICAISVTVTAALMSQYWSEQMSVFSQATANKLAILQMQLEQSKTSSSGKPVYIAEDGLTPDAIYAQNVSSVVAVISVVADGKNMYENFGSGFFLSSDGYVVTNCHVVEGATSLSVVTHNGQEYDARLIGSDATNDIALLKVDEGVFQGVQVGSSDELVVGERVAAIGNPLGELTSTLTVGYISAKDRVVTTDGSALNMLQTDAAINSGNSGGPLFNTKGQVVGIITAKYSGTSSSGASIEGIGFAIPMDDVIGMIEDLRDYGYVTGAFLGVYVRDVSSDAIRDGLPAGAFIESVEPGYCADAAGLQAKDIIVNLGGYKISNTTDLTRYLRKFDGGEVTTITIYRAGQYMDLAIKLNAKAPPAPQQQTQSQQQEDILMPGDEGFEEWYREFIDRYYGKG